ncbi:MAG: TonB-dependent receptor [Gammaproteobacteria bacterium]
MRTVVAGAAICLSIVSLSIAQNVEAAIRKATSIPAQDLAVALQTLARDRDLQVVYRSELVGELRTQGATGDLTTTEVLAQLLRGTGLTYSFIGEQAVTIVPVSVPEASRAGSTSIDRAASAPATLAIDAADTSSDAGNSPRFWDRFRLAQAGPNAATAIDTASSGKAKPGPVEEVVVVGSRLSQPKDAGAAPVTVFDRGKIDGLGAASIADVLNYLPQQSFSVPEWQNPGGARRVQLRGLASGTTLILINGRRVVPGAVGSAQNYFDLNTIPLAAVERIEVLADSASAVYGADAVGGVVNIVLKSNVERPVLDLTYGTAEGGAAERRASLSIGGSTARARGSILWDYFNRDPLLGGDRDRTRNADFTRFGGIDRRTTTADPGNICSVDGSNLPGLPTPCAAVPVGSTGIGLTPASFLATAGQRNLDTPRRFSALVPESRRYSLVATGSYDVTDRIEAFGEFLYSDRTDAALGQPPSVSGGLVPATNPFNPFGVAVRADFLLTGLPETTGPAHETATRAVAGLKGALGSWEWEFSLLESRSTGEYANAGNVDATRLSAALAATTPSLALNVFGDGPGGNAALLSSLVAVPANTTYASNSVQAGGFLKGDLFMLPAGAVQVVGGAEWRHEAIGASSPTTNLDLTTDDAKRDSSSAYAEARVPVIGGTGVPLIREVDLTLAGRYDDYSDFGNVFNAQYGLEWRPLSALLIRASRGDAYRAPGLTDLYKPQQGPFPGTTLDPRRGYQSFTAVSTVGGNPNLDPETSRSSTIGLVWTAPFAGTPRFSASYWRIEQDRRIQTAVNMTTILANESYFPGRVVREAPTPADVAAGWPGKVVSVDASLINGGPLETNGIDFEVSARFDTSFGGISPSLSATRVQKYKTADFPSTPFAERVGIANYNGTVPRWRATGSLSWNRGGVSLTGTAHYTGDYADATFNVANGGHVESQTLIDLQAAIDFEALMGRSSGLARGVVVRVGASNLFNEEPPYSDVLGNGFDSTQTSTRQRFVYVSLSKTF